MRHAEIVGIAERVATITGSVAAQAACAMSKGLVPPGVHNLGQDEVPNDLILDGVLDSGTILHQFIGRQ
jgi:hypothetical protein